MERNFTYLIHVFDLRYKRVCRVLNVILCCHTVVSCVKFQIEIFKYIYSNSNIIYGNYILRSIYKFNVYMYVWITEACFSFRYEVIKNMAEMIFTHINIYTCYMYIWWAVVRKWCEFYSMRFAKNTSPWCINALKSNRFLSVALTCLLLKYTFATSHIINHSNKVYDTHIFLLLVNRVNYRVMYLGVQRIK